MEDRIYVYELDCYKNATEQQRKKMMIREDRYFELEGFRSKEVRDLLEDFIWERGRKLAVTSIRSELLYYNNIREFLIDKKIKKLSREDEERLIRKLRGWMLEKGYKLMSIRYKPQYGKTAMETSSMERYLKKILRSIREGSEDEYEKDIWEIDRFPFQIRKNPIKQTKTLNFTKIPQKKIREEVKAVIYLHLKHKALGTVLTEMTAMNRFSMFLEERCPCIRSLLELDRDHMEEYLMYINLEATERKSFRTDIINLKSVLFEVGDIFEEEKMKLLFFYGDIPRGRKYAFQYYSDAELKRFNAHLFKMDEQIARALIIHQMLGTRISETFTLKRDCLSIRYGRYFVNIDSVKSGAYEKAVSDELAQLIIKAAEYTQKNYGDTEYIFVNKDEPTRPFQYGMIQYRIMSMIVKEDIRDDHGELLKFGTHIFRHCYGMKLTEMHVEDWMIAKLLGHKGLQSVHYYRKMSNKIMAEETRPVRDKMDMIIFDIIEDWEGYDL